MAYQSIYDAGVKARGRKAEAERLNKPEPARPKIGRVQTALYSSELLAETHQSGQFLSWFIEGGIDLEEKRARSAIVSEYLDQHPPVTKALEALHRVVQSAVWEEKEHRVRELIGPLYSRSGRAGPDPIAALAGHAGNNGPRSMGGRIIAGAEILRKIFANLSGVPVASIDYSRPKVDTSLNVKRDWMSVGGFSGSDGQWYRLARISDRVGEQTIVMMVRMAVFFEPLASVAIMIEDDEQALSVSTAKPTTVRTAGVMVRRGFKVMMD